MVLCAGAFGCYAAQGSLPGAQGQGYDLNLSYSRTTLKAVADAITQQVGIAFSYETALAGYPMENLEVSEKGATIEAILAAVFTPRGIDYRVVDKVVVLTRSTRPVPAASAAAKSEVKGVVRDAAGNPMIGVTVTIKGTLVGVSTGVDGGYAIPADGNATLLFSYIGYRPHEEVVGRRTQIDVTMQEDELVMDEVVVVGYGTLKKRNIVGAVENLSGDAVENRPNANITRSLQGQIPGLNIVQVDGKADHAGEVTIRGVNNTFKARVSGGEKTNKLGQGGGALVRAAGVRLESLAVIASLENGTVLAYSFIYSPTNYSYLLVGLLLIVLLGLSWAAMFARIMHAMTEQMVKSVDTLVREIRIIRKEDPDHIIEIDTGDEIEEIARQVNKMVRSIQELSQRNIALAEVNNRMEMQNLQAQINPHFIYNTLDNIRYLIPTDPQRAQQLIGRFIGILRYSINNTKHNVPVKDDLKYLQDYLVIQSTRFGANFSYEIDIDDACMEFIIPKLLLQPLLENSIKYGFQKKPRIHIRVRGWLGEDALYFTVEDNGGGVDETMLEQLRDILRSDEVNIEHNGLQNINRRIWLGYGGDSGLTIDSTEGEGFTVKLKLRLGGM